MEQVLETIQYPDEADEAVGSQQLHCPAGHVREARPGESSVVSSNQIKHLALTLAQHVNNRANVLLRNLNDSLLIGLALVPLYLLCDDLHSIQSLLRVHITLLPTILQL